MSSALTANDILSMPLAELRERVALAERLSIAARHAPGTDSPPKPTASANTAQSAAPVKGPAAQPTQQTATPKAQPTAKATPSDDFTDDALSGGLSSGDFELGGDDDMLAGFVEELTPEAAKEKAIAIAKQVIAKKDNSELAIARTIMQKFGVSKVSEIAAGKEVELYKDFKAGFPQYAG